MPANLRRVKLFQKSLCAVELRGPIGGEQPLVVARGEEVQLPAARIDANVACAVRAVDHAERAILVRNLRNPLDLCPEPVDPGYQANDDESGLGVYPLLVVF